MRRTNRSRSPPMRHASLPKSTRDSLFQTGTNSPADRNLVPTQADRYPVPSASDAYPEYRPAAEAKLSPSVEEFRKADKALRDQRIEEQRRRIAENEALLHKLAGIEQKVGGLSYKAHLPRGNDLTVQEQIDIIHGGACQMSNEVALEEHCQNIIDDTNAVPTVLCTGSSVSSTNDNTQTQTEQTNSFEWNDLLELDVKYPTSTIPVTSMNTPPSKNPHNLSLHHQYPITSPLCTGPCPIQPPHPKGPYLHQSRVPQVWNNRWGFSDPPREIWEAWARIEEGRGRSWEVMEVDGFAGAHWWCGL